MNAPLPPRLLADDPPVTIHTLTQAMKWGDGWWRAYRLERRARLREIKRLHDEIFRLETGITWRDGEIALLRAQLRAAGIEPTCGDE